MAIIRRDPRLTGTYRDDLIASLAELYAVDTRLFETMDERALQAAFAATARPRKP